MFGTITLENFLSFGPGAQSIALRPLNVLIGPNGSGKSNLIEALSVLRAVPRDLPFPVREGGGVDEWIWRSGEERRGRSAAIEVVFAPGVVTQQPARYRLAFGSEAGTFVVLDESIESEASVSGEQKPFVYFGYQNGRAVLNSARNDSRILERGDIDRTQSILSQRRDPESFPEVAAVGDRLKEILIYRSWSFGPGSPTRSSCGADVRTDRLLEDISNLPGRLQALKRNPATKRRLVELIAEVAPSFSDLEVIPEGGRLQLYLTEGDRNVPAHRLSDGTLRYLAILAILLEPSARLVAIEEPELGLHPDMFPALGRLLVEASEKTQLIVTTHSTQLVDTLTDHAESVVVCEKPDTTSTFRRLDQREVHGWQEFGSLGVQWMSGRLGGTRW